MVVGAVVAGAVASGTTEAGMAVASPPQASTKSSAKNPAKEPKCLKETIDPTSLESPTGYEAHSVSSLSVRPAYPARSRSS